MSLAQRNSRILFWSTLFGSVSFLEPVLTLFYLQRGLSTSHILFALTAFSASVLVFEVPTGAFADRFGPKASFLMGCLIKVLSTAVLIFAHSPWQIYLSRVLWGLAMTFFSGAEEALLYESLKESGEEERMAGVLGRIHSAGFIAGLVTQLVGAFVARNMAEQEFILLLAFTIAFTLLQFVVLLGIRNPAAFEKFRENPFVHVRNGLTTIRQTPNLVWLFINITVVFIPTYVIATFEQPYLTDAGLPVSWLGTLYALAAVTQMLISRNVEWLTARFSRVALIRWTGIVTWVMAVGVAMFQQSLVAGLLAFFLIRQARSVRFPVYSHMENEYIPSGSRATTLSLLSVLDSVFDLLIVIPLQFAAPFGRSAIYVACAVVILAGLFCPVREPQTPAEKAALQ